MTCDRKIIYLRKALSWEGVGGLGVGNPCVGWNS